MELTKKYWCKEHGITDTRCGCPVKTPSDAVLRVREYVVTPGGTWYDAATDPKVIEYLEYAMQSNRRFRVRFWLGDTATGRDWHEENDVTGFVGRTMGPIREPILIANARSTGGGIILTDCILRLVVGGVEVYRHPKFRESVYEVVPSTEAGYAVAVKVDGETHANFRTGAKAERWIAFMTGKRQVK